MLHLHANNLHAWYHIYRGKYYVGYSQLQWAPGGAVASGGFRQLPLSAVVFRYPSNYCCMLSTCTGAKCFNQNGWWEVATSAVRVNEAVTSYKQEPEVDSFVPKNYWDIVLYLYICMFLWSYWLAIFFGPVSSVEFACDVNWSINDEMCNKTLVLS